MATKKDQQSAQTEEPVLAETARDDVCRLISYACNQCIDGKTRENPAVMFEGIAALYQAIK